MGSDSRTSSAKAVGHVENAHSQSLVVQWYVQTRCSQGITAFGIRATRPSVRADSLVPSEVIASLSVLSSAMPEMGGEFAKANREADSPPGPAGLSLSCGGRSVGPCNPTAVGS